MSDTHSEGVDLFISPLGNDQAGDGTSARPFRTVEHAVETLFRRGNGLALSPRQIEIVSISSPGGGFKLSQRPKFEYFVDPLADGLDANGSDTAPWPDLPLALRRVADRHGRGGLELAPGQRIRIAQREVFTPTSIERIKHRNEMAARLVFLAMTAVLVVPVVAIMTYLIVQAWPSLTWEFLTQNPKNSATAGGIWAPLIGTFYLVFGSLLVAAPIGVLAGVYLNEFAGDNWATRIINLAVVNLAGVPSIVHALFGVGAFVVLTNRPSVIAASLTLAVMTLPVIITSTKEALASVPMAFREACWNMGASRWQTIRTIVLPNSIGGILTGVILQVSRAAGETAPILFTGAVLIKSRLPSTGLGSFFPYRLDDSCLALSYHLYQVCSIVPNVPSSMQYGSAAVLIGLVLIVNSLSIALRTYLRSRKKW